MEINKIYCMDAIDFLSRQEDSSVDMIFCDLPYGTTQCEWDSVISLDKLWDEYRRIRKEKCAILLFAQLPFDKALGMSNIKELRYEWIWEKTMATGHLNANKMPMKAHENILVFYDKLPIYNPQKTAGHKPVNIFTKYVETQNKTDVYGKVNKEISGGGNTDRFPRSVQIFSSDRQKENLHPTQKPVKLCEYLIKTYTNEGDLVLDNCIGSGTTAVACLKTGRNFIGCDISRKYVDMANKRLKELIDSY